MNAELEKATKDILTHTDGNPWYWLSYGEKDYAFACVSAITLNNDVPIPKGGTRLMPHPSKPNIWLAENGTEMIVDESIAAIERQNGDTICQFIAIAHTVLIGQRSDQ